MIRAIYFRPIICSFVSHSPDLEKKMLGESKIEGGRDAQTSGERQIYACRERGRGMKKECVEKIPRERKLRFIACMQVRVDACKENSVCVCVCVCV